MSEVWRQFMHSISSRPSSFNLTLSSSSDQGDEKKYANESKQFGSAMNSIAYGEVMKKAARDYAKVSKGARSTLRQCLGRPGHTSSQAWSSQYMLSWLESETEFLTSSRSAFGIKALSTGLAPAGVNKLDRPPAKNVAHCMMIVFTGVPSWWREHGLHNHSCVEHG